MFTVTVNTSLRYISIGSAPALLADAERRRRRRRRQDGVDAVRRSTSSKSRLISVRTFCARR